MSGGPPSAPATRFPVAPRALHTPPPSTDSPAPSWTGPIVIGAITTVLTQLMVSVLAAVVPAAASCCCMFEAIPLGLIPAWLAVSRDPRLTPGQGFAVSFIAVGIGSLCVAVVASLELRSVDTTALRHELMQMIAQWAEASGQPMPEAERAARAEQLIGMRQYVPAVVATVLTVLAGITGMIGVRFARQRARIPR